jgi:myosin-1
MWPEGAQSLTEITKRPITAATRFKNSMIGLVQNLSTKDPFYVRCIKPNEHKAPNKFDDEKVKNQVFYLGLLENVRVRRAGFAYRLTYESFIKRYKPLSKNTWPNPKAGQEPKESTSLILQEVNLESDVRYGVTKVFVRSPETVFQLEKQRGDKIPTIVVFIQKA